MRRREFIVGAAALSALAAPCVTRAQQSTPVIGFIHPGSPEGAANIVEGFRRGLADKGFFEGKNIIIEFRWGRNDGGLLPELAADLVRLKVAVIASPGNTNGAIAAKALTTTIPIVFSMGGDPVQAGLVASFNRPDGNVTGISSFNTELGGKRVSLLHDLAPGARKIALLTNLTSVMGGSIATDFREATTKLGLESEILYARTPDDIDPFFKGLVEAGADALVVAPGWPLNERRTQIITLAARRSLPTIYPVREWVAAGGLMSYGPSVADEFRQAGIYTARVLAGEKPADLPVLRPTRFEFVINTQTARAFGLTIPPGLLAIADEVIE